MSGRFAYAVGLAVGIALAACYDVPQPECGFTCGPPAVPGGEGTCPDGYVCFGAIDNRCHRQSPAFSDPCPGDAGPIVDLRPPSLISTDPGPNAANVELSRTIDVEFDEEIANFGFPNFVVEDSTGIIPGTAFFTGPGVGYRYSYQMDRPMFANTVHTVRLTNGITDLAQNPILGATWTFTTLADTTAPMVTFSSPGSGASNVSIFTTVTVNFSEPVQGIAQTTFRLVGPSGDVSASVNNFGASAELDPILNLDPATNYTIVFSNGITDLAGNALVASPITFTTAADITPPVVTFPSPQNNQPNIGVQPTISVGFSEQVTGVSETTFMLRQGATLLTAPVFASSTSAQMQPRKQLLASTVYNYTLTPGIMDLVGNTLATTTITFTTGLDGIRPHLLDISPIQGSSGNSVDTVIVLDFDELVTNVDGTTFRLLDGGAPVSASVTYQAGLDRATLIPTLPLAGNRTYVVEISPSLQDSAGNLFGTTNSTWTMTTGPDTAAPRILSTGPADAATGVALDATISVTFDEAVTNVDATSFVVMNGGTGTLASSNGGRTWTFTPAAALPPTTTVTILLTQGITDTASNTLATPFSFAFTTGP